MSEPEPIDASQLDVELMRQIDAVCRRFEVDWRAGARPPFDSYLAEAPDHARPALRAELEALERELRQSDETVARDGLGSAAEAPTMAPTEPPTQPITGFVSSSVHEEATLAPGDPATIDHGPGSTGRAGRALAPARPLLRRLRDHPRDRPRRHGRRLPGQAGQPQPARRAQDDPRRPACQRRPTSSGSTPRPRPPPTSTIRGSCRSTRSASTRASIISRWASSRGRASPNAWPTDHSRPARPPS